jgi:phage tail sheath protein FI
MTNRFLVIDAPSGLHGDVLTRWFEGFRSREPENRSFGAVYYPWLRRGDELFPPSGSVMGVIARTELERGTFGIAWPPANVPISGVTHTEVEMDWGEAGLISDAGINPIVVQPGRGVIIWGARTMSTDPAWRFINSRRIVSMISEQLRRDNEWAVFEVNDTSLWKVIERDVKVRLEQFWEAGLIAGTRSLAEFSVECSEVTNPVEYRDSGMLNVQVALRPVGTTERILIDLRLGGNGP